ncbi:MAG TPA: penicillin-binding protein 1C [Desulfotignum sp.]|nr:penicillin-binding protein 1C [Desulfotignum sp.]
MAPAEKQGTAHFERQRPAPGTRLLLFSLAGVFLLLVLPALLVWGLDKLFPLQLNHQPMATVVTASDGTPLRAFADPSGIWRYPITPDRVSPLYLQALLTYEDRWFYHHPGVNPFAMIRACFQNLAAGTIVSGGSTLTMQVARILFSTPEEGLWTAKFRQLFQALQLEMQFSKKQILGLYLTHAPFGANIEGVWAASRTWLGRDPRDLTHAEAALLAVLPQAPGFLRPDRHSTRASLARNKVLDRMAAFGVWTDDQVLAARQEPVAAFRFQAPMAAPLAARRLVREYPDRTVIRTCLDYDLQVHVASLVKSYVSSFAAHQSGAVLVVDHDTLAVKAYAGSADFLNPRGAGHVDMVTALRSPGSTLKPFVYGMAMDKGLIHSHSLLLDIPRYGQAYQPDNFTGGFLGPVSVAKALDLSLNVPAVQVLAAFGPRTFHDRLTNAGAQLSLSGPPNLSMVLGGVGTNLESLVTLYTGLSRQGISGRPRLTKDAPIQERFLMGPGAAYIIKQLLSRPLPGTEGVSRLAGQVTFAWKTGTSYGFRDAWALGIMGSHTVGVWIGRPDGTPSPGQFGAATALPLLNCVMESLPGSSDRETPPAAVTRQTICWPMGLAPDHTPGPCPVRHEAWILNNWVPPTLTETGQGPLRLTFWVDDQGRRAGPFCGGVSKTTKDLWPVGAEPWLPQHWRRNQMMPETSDACPDLAPLSGNQVKIVSISNNSMLTRPPGKSDLPHIPLQAMGGQGSLVWFLNRIPLERQNTRGLPMPEPGSYDLAVMDGAGHYDKISFTVIPGGS